MEKLNEILLEKSISIKEWITYYQNIWNKKLIATTVDLQSDMTMCEKNPDEEVMEYDIEFGRPTGKLITVSERLNQRKMIVQDTLDIIDSINKLASVDSSPDVSFTDKYWGKEALKIVVEEEKKEEVKPEAETPKTETDAPKVDEKDAEVKA